jgi:hypothetical protein
VRTVLTGMGWDADIWTLLAFLREARGLPTRTSPSTAQPFRKLNRTGASISRETAKID